MKLRKPGTFPPVSSDPADLPKVLRAAKRKGYIGADWEWLQDGTPTLAGLSGGQAKHIVSCEWSEAELIIREALNCGLDFVAYSGTNADRPITDKALGIETDVRQWQDAMIWHYLCNADFTKQGAKDKDDEKENRGQGLLNLWIFSSLYTDLPAWKACRGAICKGPCREHDQVGYNGIDAGAVDLGYEPVRADAKEKKIPLSLYHHLQDMTVLGGKMQDQGVMIDMDYIKRLEKELEEKKASIFTGTWETRYHKKTGKPLKKKKWVWEAPFNPNSPQQVKRYFKKAGITLRNTEKETIQKAYKAASKRKSTDKEALKWLSNLFDYKDAGQGLSTWFNEKFIDINGLAHPRFIPTGTSMGRPSSANPNFFNIPKRGFGKNVRRAIIPRGPKWILVGADSKQLELRMVLYEAGVEEDYTDDAFSWLVKAGDGLFEKTAELSPIAYFQNPRNCAKRTAHATDYMEGIKILYPRDLDKASIRKQYHAGALRIHKDWEYDGGVVAFTGVNLADDLLGGHSYEQRKTVLEARDKYLERFHQILKWQMGPVTECAERGYCRSKTGRYLALRGTAKDRIKDAAAFFGQGQSADYIQEGMLKFDRVPLLHVYDENFFELPRKWTDNDYVEYMQTMAQESKLFPGFSCPIDVEVGENWLDTRKAYWHNTLY